MIGKRLDVLPLLLLPVLLIACLIAIVTDAAPVVGRPAVPVGPVIPFRVPALTVDLAVTRILALIFLRLSDSLSLSSAG